ncbi:MAG TPA: MarR family transcriptional regulator [Candidatus Saccharimonadia bacterium]|nr:MarR family transcriptional regulator [Candidatus Saccharimonadia bacterium]
MLSKRRTVELGAKHSLTGMQAMMLVLLDKPHPMFSFKKVFNCDASNITGIVDGLEQKSLATRFPDPDDRRIKMIKLTADGAQLRDKMLKQAAGPNGSLLTKLSDDELKTFTELLTKITNGSATL